MTSDLDMLSKLLDCGKLVPEDSNKARAMYDDLFSGRAAKLDD